MISAHEYMLGPAAATRQPAKLNERDACMQLHPELRKTMTLMT
jgi:hypothetical protein